MARKTTQKPSAKPKADPQLDYVATKTCWIAGVPRKAGDPLKLTARVARFEPVMLASEVSVSK